MWAENVDVVIDVKLATLFSFTDFGGDQQRAMGSARDDHGRHCSGHSEFVCSLSSRVLYSLRSFMFVHCLCKLL